MGVRDEAPMWDEVPALVELDWFKTTVDKLASLKTQIKQLEAEAKEVALDAESGLAAADIKRVKFGDHFLIEQAGGRSPNKISATKLAEHGVPAETIRECTVPGKAYSYVQVIDLSKKPGEKGGPPEHDPYAE